MAEFETTVEGIRDIIRSTDDIENLLRELSGPSDDLLDIILEKVRFYPPPPAGSTYIRTFRLKNSWEKQLILRGDTIGLVRSVSPDYNKFVMSRADQAAIHQVRWKTVEDISEELDDTAERIFEEKLEDILQ